MSKVDEDVDSSCRDPADGLSPLKQRGKEAHLHVHSFHPHHEPAMASEHLDAGELEPAEGDARLFDRRLEAEAVADESGSLRGRPSRAPDENSGDQQQHDHNRYQPRTPLAEEPQHSPGSMPRLQPEA